MNARRYPGIALWLDLFRWIFGRKDPKLPNACKSCELLGICRDENGKCRRGCLIDK